MIAVNNILYSGSFANRPSGSDGINWPTSSLGQYEDSFYLALDQGEGTLYYCNGLQWLLAGGAAEKYTNPLPATVSVGGVPAGTTFVSQSMKQMFDAIFYPYQNPAFTSFGIVGQSSTMEVGNSVPAGTKTFSWSTSNPANVAPNSIYLSNANFPTNPDGPNINTGTRNIFIPVPIVKTTINATEVFGISGTNTKSGSFSTNYSITWRPRRYRGRIPSSSLPNLLSAANHMQIDPFYVPGLILDASEISSTKFTGNNVWDLSSFSSPGGIIFWLYPSGFGTSTFLQGSFTYPTILQTKSNFINQYSVNLGNYNLYYSAVPSVGSAISVTVS
jgi:hypothetical protein